MKRKISLAFSVLLTAILCLQAPAGAKGPPPPRPARADLAAGFSPAAAVTSRAPRAQAEESYVWARQIIDAANETGAHASMTIDPRDKTPYVSYYDATPGDLRLASPVAPGSGNCGPDNSWWCRTVVQEGDVGRFSSIDTWYDGAVWKLGIAYYNATTYALDYAEYTEQGSAWNWTYATVQQGGLISQAGQYASLRFSPAGEPAIAFYENTPMGSDRLELALYNPTAKSAPAAACTNPNFQCQTIDSGEGVGRYASLAWSGGEVWTIAYYAADSAALKVAHQHTAGNCGGGYWQCDSIAPMAGASGVQGAGDKVSLQATTGMTLTVAYYNGAADALWMAGYPTARLGNCGPGNSWVCSQVEGLGAGATGGESVGLSLALDGDGLPLVGYNDVGEGNVLKVARPAAAGGNCGSGGVAWRCDVVDDGLRGSAEHDVGRYPAAGFDANGKALVAYQDATAGDLLVAKQEAAPAAAACGGVYPATADTTLYSDAPDQPHGGDTQLDVMSSGTYTRTALLAFDLGTTIPPGSTITSAELELSLSQDPAPLPYRLEVRAVAEAWDEATATWNNAPALGAALAPETHSLGAAALLRVDVRALANLWATGKVTETSVLLQPAAGEQVDVRLASREIVDPEDAPRLVVRCAPYSPPPPRNGATGDARQIAGLARLKAASVPTTTLRIENGAVRFAALDVPVPEQVPADGLSRAEWFTGAFSDALRLADPQAELQLVRRSPDDQTLFFRQRHLGIPVFPAEMAVHLTGGHVTSLAGAYVPDITLQPTPALTAEQAGAIALALGGAGEEVVGDVQLRYLNLGLIGNADQNTYLTWQVPLLSAVYFIDAGNGVLRLKLSRVRPEYEMDMYSGSGWPEQFVCALWKAWSPLGLMGDAMCHETGCHAAGMSDPDANPWGFWNISDVWHWWNYKLGRDSYDGLGAQVNMFLHTVHQWPDGTYGANAVWMSSCGLLMFSDGYARALDVVGHEFAHAVDSFTANLVYQDQPGAINESMSDVFGAFTQTFNRNDPGNPFPFDPACGEGLPGGAIRDMANPGLFGQPDQMAGMCTPANNFCDYANDSGGVHTNSGIPNKVASLIVTGGFFNGYHIDHPMGVNLAPGFYNLLLYRLPSNADFSTLRDVAINTAYELATASQWHGYGYTRPMACSVQNAFASVGLGSGDGNCDRQDDVTALDTDGDYIPDFYSDGTPHDNCPTVKNPGQENLDDGWGFDAPFKDNDGDVCDPDDDNDGAPDVYDTCPWTYNPGQEDTVHPGNGVGDACDDPDGDWRDDRNWVTGAADNCPDNSNPDQTDTDGDLVGDRCDPDLDGDGFCNVGGPLPPGTPGAWSGCFQGPSGADNCQYKPNPSQQDGDGDGWGDDCDNCPGQASAANMDTDHDQFCNEYDPDSDNDRICDNGGPLQAGTPGAAARCDPGPSGHDNCPTVSNYDQIDSDDNGMGRACDGAEMAAIAEHAVQEYFDFWSHTYVVDYGLSPPMPHDGHPDYLDPGYLYEVNVELTVPFAARVVDDLGNVIAQTGLDAEQPRKQSLTFAPTAYWTATGPARGARSQSLGPDDTGYRLEVAPVGGFIAGEAYTLTVEVTAGVPHSVYLPVVTRRQ